MDIGKISRVHIRHSLRIRSRAPRVVVAIDFGTTFSGFSYAWLSEPNNVKIFTDWPFTDLAGFVPYCKTQTSLYYVKEDDGKDGGLKLQSWAWRALVDYRDACASNKRSGMEGYDFCAPSTSNRVSINGRVGHFITRFKLRLAEDIEGRKEAPEPLPRGLTTERTIVDFLRKMSGFALEHIQEKYGNHMSMADIQWCLTVPAIWEEGAKQMMRNCAAKAGMVQNSSTVHIILEPEAASIYCQRYAEGKLSLRQGDKLMVVDVGGGTIDIVVHQKTDDDPQNIHVEEVVASYGELGGGTFVDANFFAFMCHKIGCLDEYFKTHPSYANRLHKRWLELKAQFDGDGFPAVHLDDLPSSLTKAWQAFDNSKGILKDGPYAYEEVRLDASDIKAIFDPEVEKVLDLIDRHVEEVRALMVVGGFSASPYLKKRIRRRFGGTVEEIIIPEDPGSAICVGAVQLHMAQEDPIRSRIAKRTYGVKSSRDATDGDPEELLFTNDDNQRKCGSTFSVIVTKGDKVPLDACFNDTYTPVYHNQKKITFPIVSSHEPFPKYTTDAGVKKEGEFTVNIEEDMAMDKKRRVEVSMKFGASLISVTARRLNFGDTESTAGHLDVEFTPI